MYWRGTQEVYLYWRGTQEVYWRGIQEVYWRGIQEVYRRGIQEVYWRGIQEVYWRGIQEVYRRGITGSTVYLFRENKMNILINVKWILISRLRLLQELLPLKVQERMHSLLPSIHQLYDSLHKRLHN